MRRQTQNCLSANRVHNRPSALNTPVPHTHAARTHRQIHPRTLPRTSVSVPTSAGGLLCYLAVVCLFFSQTNFLPISASLFAFLPVYLFLSRSIRGSLDMAILGLSGCFILSAALLDASSLIEYDFYRRDGNFFVAWAPLLLLSRVQYRLDLGRVLRWFIVISAVICAGTIVAWKLGQWRPGTSEFFHLFYAHNAAGGFLAVACGFAIALLHRRGLTWVWAVAPLGAGLVMTNSRGSLLGFGLALVMVYLVPKRAVWVGDAFCHANDCRSSASWIQAQQGYHRLR